MPTRNKTKGLSRRAWLAAGAAAGMTGVAAAKTPLTDDIRAFVALGEHRTGTPGEAATAAWLTRRLGALGYALHEGRFGVRTLLDPEGSLAVEGLAPIRAWPQWLIPEPAEGRMLEGPLSLTAAPAEIQVLDHPFPPDAYWRPAQQKVAGAAHAAGALALVMAIDEPTDAIYACNQEADAPLPLPVATVSRSDLARLVIAAREARRGRLMLSGVAAEKQGLWLRGVRAGPQPVVISTPLTGWFTCGAERGPGIALWLRLAATLARAGRPAILLGTGGHELGHRGMRAALKAGLPPPDAVAGWVHLGAGIGATALDAKFGRPSPRGVTIAPALRPLLENGLDAIAWPRRPPGPGAPGEAGDVIDAGYGARFVGLAGTFPGFHTRSDDGSAVDAARLEAIGATLDRLVLAL